MTQTNMRLLQRNYIVSYNYLYAEMMKPRGKKKQLSIYTNLIGMRVCGMSLCVYVFVYM